MRELNKDELLQVAGGNPLAAVLRAIKIAGAMGTLAALYLKLQPHFETVYGWLPQAQGGGDDDLSGS